MGLGWRFQSKNLDDLKILVCHPAARGNTFTTWLVDYCHDGLNGAFWKFLVVRLLAASSACFLCDILIAWRCVQSNGLAVSTLSVLQATSILSSFAFVESRLAVEVCRRVQDAPLLPTFSEAERAPETVEPERKYTLRALDELHDELMVRTG